MFLGYCMSQDIASSQYSHDVACFSTGMKEQVKCAMAIFSGGNARGPCQGRDDGKLAFQMRRNGRKGTAGGEGGVLAR